MLIKDKSFFFYASIFLDCILLPLREGISNPQAHFYILVYQRLFLVSYLRGMHILHTIIEQNVKPNIFA